jgi:hypothetical protein
VHLIRQLRCVHLRASRIEFASCVVFIVPAVSGSPVALCSSSCQPYQVRQLRCVRLRASRIGFASCVVLPIQSQSASYVVFVVLVDSGLSSRSKDFRLVSGPGHVLGR